MGPCLPERMANQLHASLIFTIFDPHLGKFFIIIFRLLFKVSYEEKCKTKNFLVGRNCVSTFLATLKNITALFSAEFY